MTRFRRQLRQTLTIARRDFIATVLTPIFLLFLFAPVIMGAFGAIGGLGAASVADGSRDKSRIIVIAPVEDRARLVAVDRRLRGIFRPDQAPPRLRVDPPAADPAAQARAAFDATSVDASAVLYGPLDRPTVLYAPQGFRAADYLAELAEQTMRVRDGGGADLSKADMTMIDRTTSSQGGRDQAAFLAVFGVFFLTLFLAGQVVGTMAEERNNKVIEVLAAAVPLESVFLGKLLGLFGVALLFVGFWGVVVSRIGALLPAEASAGLASLTPAVGFGPFAFLFAGYFTTAYLLLGSVFLGIGAQASTMREIQMLSLPITAIQIGMFGLASLAARQPGSWAATVAEVFPLSSPFAMAGHAANSPDLWPHAAALAWQFLWVTIFITVGARWFRRGVLQSGGAKSLWRRLFARGG